MKDTILREVQGLLEYEKAMGLREIPVSKKEKQIKGQKNLNKEGKSVLLKKLKENIGDCRKCRLHEGRTHLVFGVGNPDADLIFIGEGPGRDEDMQGIPFVGRAGQLLTKIIGAMGLKREDVYIANIVKCRPPQNRNPEQDEADTCIPYLIKQVEIIQPKIIVCLGSVAVKHLLKTEDKITQIRGKLTEWNGIPVMPTYHPAFLLRNPNMKRPVWEDMQEVMAFLSR